MYKKGVHFPSITEESKAKATAITVLARLHGPTVMEGFLSVDEFFHEWKVPEDERPQWTVVFAWYEVEGYEGSAWALLFNKNDGALYEVNGSHCSCYGLEECWSPELTSLDAIALRDNDGAKKFMGMLGVSE